MSMGPFLMASLSDLAVRWQDMNPHTRELLAGVAAVLLLVVLVLVVVTLSRKRRHHSRHHHSHDPVEDEALETAEPDGEDATPRKRRKWRRRRRPHRPRNPTLAETGGLPPLRSDPPSDPPA
jgi:hypothetical protein